MEDEDGESINVDSWPVSEENSFKDSLHGCETLNNKANNVADYLDGVEENKEETSSDDKIFHSKLVFKGFKKRILAQTQDNQLPERIINQDLSLTSSPKSSKDRSNDNKRGKITEYAQYLGLQPIGKYKCPKCNPIVTFRTMAMLKQHQSVCMSNTNSNHILPSTSDQQIINNTISSSTNNFRISRKVYLCSACGTYFENWNLFLHMREIHKRHICLFCLGMFGQAERLSHHLVKKHSVPETQFHTVDDFYTVFKGSCYLICCICEKVFSETDDFYTHNCDSINQRLITNSLCSVCRQTDGKHLSTCKFDINYERNNSNDRIQASDSEQTLFPNPANAMAKKLLGANKSRFKTNERAILSSYKSKLLNLYAKNVKSKIINRNCELSINTINNSSSKFDNDRLIHFNNTIKNRHIVEIDVTKSPAHETTIDKYTDTIMKVSQCKNIKNYDEFQMNFDIDEEIDPDDYNQMNNFDDTSDNIEKGELILDDGNDDTPIGSPIASPNHLNFTSNQEPIIKNLDQLNSSCINSDDNIDCNNTPAEELPNLTVSRVNSTNRSLVIKICANKNSQFSVSTPNVNGNYDDNEDEDDEEEEEEEEEEDGESEDNNKSGGSEKELSINDHESDSDGENLITKLPEELNIGNNIEPIIEPTTQVSIVNTTEDEGEIKAPEDPTDLSTATESSTVAAANESTLINEEENKITEISQTKETTFEIEPITSETIKLNNENELLLNIDNSKSNDSIIIDKTNELSNDKKDENFKNDKELISSDEITLANDETPSIDINVDGTLDSIEIDDLLKRCIEAASPTCIYCNHARHIAVNGKQLALHMLAEHRFQPQHPAIIIQHDQFNTRVKKSLNELTSSWFNLDSYDNKRGTYNVSTVKIYECYLCHIYYSVHKELCLHNRKMHQKTILICIMCKSTFYSHSELVCHLCPGIYSSHINIRYRCCLCDIESLPSAFRLMVHLRKRHHACDVCLESTGNQQRLSNHVWKHKLHHLCYRCGIAYRNKPDITKHLFWKHGTESVLCKKCLQKKWPHIYHFCIPPSAFVCDECGATFSRAVALKVHKRLHTGDEPHECLECSARFISKKLLDKHSDTHKPLKIQSLPLQFNNDNEENHQINVDVDVHTGVICNNEIQNESNDEIKNVTVNLPKDNVKKVLDVYDLPPLNLSSDSDTDVEDDKLSLRKDSNVDNSQNVEGINDNDNIDVEMVNLIDNSSNKSTIVENFEVKLDNIADNILSTETNDNICDVDESNEEEIKKEEVVIMNGIWDNFKSYTASLEVKEQSNIIDNELPKNHELLNIIAIEHDYCTVYDDNSKEENEIISNSDVNNDEQIKAELNSSINEINVSANGDNTNDITKRKTNKSPKKKTKQSQDNVDGSSSSSDSSSDSDSSSCSCGTNCSCSSSSSGSSTSSSSSSDSDSSTSESSPKKSSVVKKDRRKDKDTKKNRNKDLLSESTHVDVEIQIETKNNIETIDNRVEEEIKENTNANEQTIDNIILPPAPSPLRESDLETDETETDEDFYDEYPQQHANNLLAEKRNQLMLLATVAPQSADDSALGSSSNDMKNGNIIDNSIPMTNSPSEQLSMTQTSTNTKRKIKTKRRKKGEGGRGRGKRQQNSLQSTPTIVNQLPIIESIKLNIPKILYRNKKPGVRRNSSSPNVNTVKTREPKLPAVTYQISQTDYNINQLGQLKTPNAHNVSNDNESANENKRSSKRKRVPKKFYGDSSDEDQRLSNSFNQKWRRIDTQIPTNSYVPSITIKQNYGPPSSTFQSTTNYQPASVIPEPQTETLSVPISTPAREPTPVSSVADSDNPPDDSSSDSSTSEIEQPRHHPPRQHPGDDNSQGTMLPNRQANLYCYCQCPYDEVSEMIACDGDSCRIEWFHFECVGIMVPPKGKWYCPDCSKRDPTLPSNEYFV